MAQDQRHDLSQAPSRLDEGDPVGRIRCGVGHTTLFNFHEGTVRQHAGTTTTDVQEIPKGFSMAGSKAEGAS